MISTPRILGLYQIIGGVLTLFAIGRLHSERGPTAVGILILLAGLAIAAGVTLWRGGRGGWRLTMLNQILQLGGFYTSAFAYTVIHGAGLTFGTRYFGESTLAESNVHTSAQLLLGSSTCDVLWGRMLAGMPDYGLTVNLLALGILIYVLIVPNNAPKSA